MKRLAIRYFILVCLAPFCSLALSQGLVVGTLFDHTGALKDWGPRHQNAAQLAVSQMAAAGWEITLVHEDSQTAAEPAKKAAAKLIGTDKVVAIIGSSSSGVTVPVAESITSRTASEMLMIKRVMLKSVSVTGPPFLICSRKMGITDPRDPRTLPNRVDAKIGPFPLKLLLAAVMSRSPMSLEVPMTFVGLTALSEEVKMTRST